MVCADAKSSLTEVMAAGEAVGSKGRRNPSQQRLLQHIRKAKDIAD